MDKKGNTNYQTGKILKLKKGNKKINYGHNYKGITQWVADNLKLYIFLSLT